MIASFNVVGLSLRANSRSKVITTPGLALIHCCYLEKTRVFMRRCRWDLGRALPSRSTPAPLVATTRNDLEFAIELGKPVTTPGNLVFSSTCWGPGINRQNFQVSVWEFGPPPPPSVDISASFLSCSCRRLIFEFIIGFFPPLIIFSFATLLFEKNDRGRSSKCHG